MASQSFGEILNAERQARDITAEELALILREPLNTVTRWLWHGVEPEPDHQANILKTIEKAPRTAKA